MSGKFEEEILKVREKIKEVVKKRLEEFKKLGARANEDELFSELCFCILTANSTAKKGIEIQQKLGKEGFLTLEKEKLAKRLKELGHRFYNKRAEFIVEARRKRKLLKEIVKKDEKEAREILVREFKGIGYKEASHFLRNIGKLNVAILDRHILKEMEKYSLINKVPKTLTRKKYLEIEKELEKFSKKLGIKLGELDLYIWYKATGKVLK